MKRVLPPVPLLGACLIVRNEEDDLPGCLETLRGVVDEIVVYDTGSSDRTIELARAHGAIVVLGTWTDDFAAARNAALASASTTWVLSIDADERVAADAVALRAALAGAVTPGLLIEIQNVMAPDAGGDYWYHTTKIFRRAGVRWEGWVHERPCGPDGAPLDAVALAPSALRLVHDGYATPERQLAAAQRNAAIGRRELAALSTQEHPDPRRVGQVLVDLGRSLIGAGRIQDAVDAFTALRELAPNSPQVLEGTDFLIRLLLGEGNAEAALSLVGELHDRGVNLHYCHWLASQALVQMGDAASAWTLIQPVGEIVDTAGRRSSPGELHETRALVAAAAGLSDTAAEELAKAMGREGRIAGRGTLLRNLWRAAGRHGDPLALLIDQGGPHKGTLQSELARVDRENGPTSLMVA